jgi:hypothetical protein
LRKAAEWPIEEVAADVITMVFNHREQNDRMRNCNEEVRENGVAYEVCIQLFVRR